MRFVTETQFQAAQKLHAPAQLPWRAYARWLLRNAPSTVAAHADRALLLRALTPRQALTAVLHCAQDLSGTTQCFALYGATLADMDAVLTCTGPASRVHNVRATLASIPAAYVCTSVWLIWLGSRLATCAPLAFLRALEPVLLPCSALPPKALRRYAPSIACWLADFGYAQSAPWADALARVLDAQPPWADALANVLYGQDREFYELVKAFATRMGQGDAFQPQAWHWLYWADDDVLAWALAEGIIHADEAACVAFAHTRSRRDVLQRAGGDAQLLDELDCLALFEDFKGPSPHTMRTMDELLARMLATMYSSGNTVAFERLWKTAPESLRARLDTSHASTPLAQMVKGRRSRGPRGPIFCAL